MARPNHEREPDDKKGPPPEAAAWGTWEELLLAYAVNRFGTNSWDSISSELRKRSTAAIVFTPKHCKQKYQELERRFGQSNGDDDSGTTAAAAVPWIEELRKLRVEELERQLQNFDVYISSLQLKVKKLTEEGKKPDLGHKIDEIEIKNEEEGDNKPPDLVISGEERVPVVDESDRDNQSMNGSNGNLETGAEKSENESSPVRTVDGKTESSPTSPIRPEDSNKVRPDPLEPVKTEPGDVVSQEPESKSEGTLKENSDVQSSASKSMKERNDRVRRGSSKTDERENEDQSRNSIPVKSLPLIDILQKVHKLGSAFLDRRLDRQEKLRYKNLIREHIDFEILQTRLKEGWYSDGNKNFFRDLLLLVNNTFIFFPNESQESISATDLRKFIMNEMSSKKKQKTDSKPTTLPPKQQPNKLIICKKRSSIASKETTNEKEPLNEKEKEREFSSGSKKTSKSNKPVESEEKKRGATKFLNRMKESLAASKNEAEDVAAGGGSGSGGGGGGQKRGGEGKRSSGQRKEVDSPTKKNVGRPPKKGAVVAAQPPATAGFGKRNREESESLAAKQGKKKSKKL